MKADEARQKILDEAVADARESLSETDDWLRALDRHLASTRRSAFRRDPALEARYEAVYRKLNGARELLRAARAEGDVESVKKAGERIAEALAEIQSLSRAVGAPDP